MDIKTSFLVFPSCGIQPCEVSLPMVQTDEVQNCCTLGFPFLQQSLVSFSFVSSLEISHKLLTTFPISTGKGQGHPSSRMVIIGLICWVSLCPKEKLFQQKQTDERLKQSFRKSSLITGFCSMVCSSEKKRSLFEASLSRISSEP